MISNCWPSNLDPLCDMTQFSISNWTTSLSDVDMNETNFMRSIFVQIITCIVISQEPIWQHSDQLMWSEIGSCTFLLRRNCMMKGNLLSGNRFLYLYEWPFQTLVDLKISFESMKIDFVTIFLSASMRSRYSSKSRVVEVVMNGCASGAMSMNWVR